LFKSRKVTSSTVRVGACGPKLDAFIGLPPEH
jgi:hypothetical protein